MASGALAAKQQLLALDRKRVAMEADIEALMSTLEPVGMSAPLVDADGFPRADVDVMRVRETRVQIVKLHNDLKAIMKQCEQALLELHSFGPAALVAAPTLPTASAAASTPADGSSAASAAMSAARVEHRCDCGDHLQLRPFALVTEVFPASPAAEAGLMAGDEIVSFHDLRAGRGSPAALPSLTQLAVAVREHATKPLYVCVLRKAGAAVAASSRSDGDAGETRVAARDAYTLQLVPHAWSGTGLLTVS